MPKGIPKKKRAYKKAAKETPVKRKYTRRATVEVAESAKSTPVAVVKQHSTKEEILDTLKKFHVEYTDKDGHIAIRNTQMLDKFTITELMDNGVQIMNARRDETGAYIALYY